MVAFGSSKGGAKRGRVKWLSVLMGVGILLITGTVVADVVLTYALNNTVGSTNTSPFEWEQGPNYGAANSLSLLTTTCNTATGTGLGASATNCYQLSNSVSGVSFVPTTLINVESFVWMATSASVATDVSSTYLSLVAGTGTLAAGACAYAFISNGALTTTSFTYSAATPCSVTVAAPTAAYAACGATTAGGVTIVNLAANSVSGTYSCPISAGTAAGTVLDVSYFIYIPGSAVTGVALSSILVTPTLS
ncbi:MAG: hypothetical protein M1144_00830 [Candidatus Thermoplasmatota archaeon]|jgi:hypothetical protein|nr:hypothetical protein [Candidatus Thermoplasmatota archaeon]MCL5984316.1 hypothetical protein [Candidatus Thermoplasmatota archaeon]